MLKERPLSLDSVDDLGMKRQLAEVGGGAEGQQESTLCDDAQNKQMKTNEEGIPGNVISPREEDAQSVLLELSRENFTSGQQQSLFLGHDKTVSRDMDVENGDKVEKDVLPTDVVEASEVEVKSSGKKRKIDYDYSTFSLRVKLNAEADVTVVEGLDPTSTIEELALAWNGLREKDPKKRPTNLANVEFERLGEKFKSDAQESLMELGIFEETDISVVGADPFSSSPSSVGFGQGSNAKPEYMHPNAKIVASPPSQYRLYIAPDWTKEKMLAEINLRVLAPYAPSVTFTELKSACVDWQRGTGQMLDDIMIAEFVANLKESEQKQSSSSSSSSGGGQRKYTVAQLSSLPGTWDSNELRRLTSAGKNKLKSHPLSAFNFNASGWTAESMRKKLIETQILNDVLLVDNPEACNLVGHISAALVGGSSSSSSSSSSSGVALPQGQGAYDACILEDAAKLREHRVKLTTLHFNVFGDRDSLARLSEIIGMPAAKRAKWTTADYGDDEFVSWGQIEDAFKLWQQKNHQHISKEHIIEAGVSYLPATLRFDPPGWMVADYVEACELRQIKINTTGPRTGEMKQRLGEWILEHDESIPRPKRARMKQFSSETIRGAVQARGLKTGGRKIELEERLLGWEGHGNLVQKREKCFFCLLRFEEGSLPSSCAENCGAGLDFATCEACVKKLCTCSKLEAKKKTDQRLYKDTYLGYYSDY